MEVNSVNEVLFVAEATCRVLDPLDLGVDRFAGRIGDPVAQVGDDVSNRRFSIRATSIIGLSRLRRAQFCHQRKCLRAGRS